MAAQSKLNDITIKKICDAVRAGSYEAVAAISAGISETTLHQWKRRALWEPNGAHAEFVKALASAHADAEVSLVATVRMAAKGEWRAAVWLLTHRYKERWNDELSASTSSMATSTQASGEAADGKDAVKKDSPDEVMQFLRDVMQGNIAANPARLKAAELLGKRHNLWTEKEDDVDKPAKPSPFGAPKLVPKT